MAKSRQRWPAGDCAEVRLRRLLELVIKGEGILEQLDQRGVDVSWLFVLRAAHYR